MYIMYLHEKQKVEYDFKQKVIAHFMEDLLGIID